MKVTCLRCKLPVLEGAATCDSCGSSSTNITLEFVEGIAITDGERDVTVTDGEGATIAESISKEFGSVSAHVFTEFGVPSIINSKRDRINGFEDEGAAAAALVFAFNKKHQTNYAVEEKLKEDSDYADRIFVSHDNAERIPIQIRHLDDSVIASIGKEKEFKGTREASEITARIDLAIADKAQVDIKLKSSVILLLQIPSPLGKILKREIQRSSFNLRGFREVWVSPFREECFEVFSTCDDEEQIAIAAFYRWQREGPYWGNDQHHWYGGLDDCRGIGIL